MIPAQRDRLRRGFTLLELLIVILIVSLVLFMGFSAVKMEKPKPKARKKMGVFGCQTLKASNFPFSHGG